MRGGGQWLTCPHPWEPVFREITYVRGKPPGTVGSVFPPPAQIPLPTVRAGRGSGQVRAGIGPGAKAGKVPWPLLRERRQSSLSLPTLGWVWRPVCGDGFGERGASSCPLHSSGGGTLRSGASVRKGLCSSTSSILYSLNSTPSLWAGNIGYPFGTALGYYCGECTRDPPAKLGETGPCSHDHTLVEEGCG